MRRLGAVLLTLGVLAAPCAAASPLDQQATALISQQLASPQTVQAAVAGIEELLAVEPASAAAQLRAGWLRSLMDVGRFEDVHRLALQALLASPGEPGVVETLQRYRVLALLKLDKPKEALSAARGLFNICAMSSTEQTLLLVAECLNRARPEDPGAVDRLRREQMAGAVEPSEGAATAPATRPAVISTVLAGIPLETELYAASLKRLEEESAPMPPPADLWARGNLLLLSGRAAEARAVFKRLEPLVDYRSLTAAREALAKCDRAEDGTIGRANAGIRRLKAGNP